ncbi:hypothetical protein CLF_109206 [Clonorchis sinensis]|uniref:Uncharacterized protein n=1 Tax=Clonorchis sinensis TaxID=79923 RepID=G7YSD8_CLOSI|nr:hypothetical protein CLF_109206 [Clonorchis sinensis]
MRERLVKKSKQTSHKRQLPLRCKSYFFMHVLLKIRLTEYPYIKIANVNPLYLSLTLKTYEVLYVHCCLKFQDRFYGVLPKAVITCSFDARNQPVNRVSNLVVRTTSTPGVSRERTGPNRSCQGFVRRSGRSVPTSKYNFIVCCEQQYSALCSAVVVLSRDLQVLCDQLDSFVQLGCFILNRYVKHWQMFRSAYKHGLVCSPIYVPASVEKRQKRTRQRTILGVIYAVSSKNTPKKLDSKRPSTWSPLPNRKWHLVLLSICGKYGYQKTENRHVQTNSSWRSTGPNYLHFAEFMRPRN